MSRRVDVGAVDEFAEGAMKAVSVEGRELLVARAGGVFYAADERCPHLRGHLSRGTLEGTVVRCPLHGSRFDLTDGSVVQWTGWSGVALTLGKLVKPPRPLPTYRAVAENGRLTIEVD